MASNPIFSAVSPAEYLREELPSFNDDRIAAAVRHLLEHAPSDVAEIRAQMTDAEAWLLVAFAIRMASLAVRERNGRRLTDALTALTLEGGALDVRESQQVLALVYDAASRTGADGAALFAQRASDDHRSRLSDAIRQFPARDAHGRSIEAMGFKVVGEGTTFRYERRW